MILAVVLLAAALVVGIAALAFFMMVGKLTLDLGWGRSLHRLGPVVVRVAAPRDLVFDQIAAPYLGRTPRAVRSHLEVLERGSDLVVALHRTTVGRYTAETVESVGFERPERVAFRTLRGPVPHAVEEFVLTPVGNETELEYRGELGADFWLLGRLALRRFVGPVWEREVRRSMEGIREGAEARAVARARRSGNSPG